MSVFADFGSIFGVDPLMIFFLLLLLYGAKKLPELARGLGLAIRDFRKAKREFFDDVEMDQAKDLARTAGEEEDRPSSPVAWVLVPFGVIFLLSYLGAITRGEVLGAGLVVLLLFWVGWKYGELP